MDESKLWREILFLLIPLLVMIGLTMVLGCTRNRGPGEVSKWSKPRDLPDDPYADLHVSSEEPGSRTSPP